MRISELQLRNFKRFTNLSLEQISETSKLVLLIGSNGSGKSSVFDAFELMNSFYKGDDFREDMDYHKKRKKEEASVRIVCHNGAEIEVSTRDFRYPAQKEHPGISLYGRTSFRQVSRLTRHQLGSSAIEKDADRPHYYIDRDERFENDIENIVGTLLKDVFLTEKSGKQIKEKYIEPVNQSFERIFGGNEKTTLRFTEFIPPLEDKTAQILFRKGESEIHYDYLGAGEKEIFNIILNLLTRRPFYQDTIYFFDELDLHLNTKLQFNLLKEITEHWIPESSQLWTASHSLGFIEYANQADHASIIDLDDLDYDYPQIVVPAPKDTTEVYEIAVGKEFLPSLFKDIRIVFVENKDKDYYASSGVDNTVFVSDNNRNSVFHKVKDKSTGFEGIVDRDFLSDDDIRQIKKHYPKLHVLDYYSIENYLYHPDNLEAYHQKNGEPFDKDSYIKQLIAVKNEIKKSLIPTLALKRTEYPYFREPEYNEKKELIGRFKNSKENEKQAAIIADYIESDDFETFYKSFPMKTYATQLHQRQNVSKSQLAKTDWFKSRVEELLVKS